MPSHGQHSFLLPPEEERYFILSKCQCPHTGNTHFYAHQCVSNSLKESGCVNALTRATLISTGYLILECVFSCLCQCPQTGNTHFYLDAEWVAMLGEFYEWQCPQTGNTHFYRYSMPHTDHKQGCVNALTRATLISTGDIDAWETREESVNALKRATLISTVPPQKPLFYAAY